MNLDFASYTAAHWAWLAFALFGPLPLVWIYRVLKARRDARKWEEAKEYRRQKFGGFVSTVDVKDGKRVRVSKPLDRPDGERTDAPRFWREHWSRSRGPWG